MGENPTTIMPTDPNASNLTVDCPKTLIVDLSTKYGGSTSRVLSLLSRFPNGRVSLAGLEGSAITQEAQKAGLPVHIVGRKKTDPQIIMRLVKLIRKNNIQVLDSQNIQSKLYASLASTLTNTALVSTINSWYANEHGGKSIKGWIYTAIELMTNWNLSLYITVSEKDKQSLLSSGVTADKIELIYNAVEVETSSVDHDKYWLHKKINLPHDSLICTSVGRLVHIKGFDILIKAAALACKEIPQLILVIIGEGEIRNDLMEQIQEAGLQDRGLMPGYFDRKEVLRALASSDMFTMPSRYEGTPIALLEAAALARPIIASSTGGIPELVTDEEHALLVPPEDPDALAVSIIRICKEKSLAEKIANNAFQRVKTKFNLETQASTTSHAYQNVWSLHQQEK